MLLKISSYPLMKVIMITGIAGTCRKEELLKIILYCHEFTHGTSAFDQYFSIEISFISIATVLHMGMTAYDAYQQYA